MYALKSEVFWLLGHPFFMQVSLGCKISSSKAVLLVQYGVWFFKTWHL